MLMSAFLGSTVSYSRLLPVCVCVIEVRIHSRAVLQTLWTPRSQPVQLLFTRIQHEWILSRTCDCRIVYFLALEVTWTFHPTRLLIREVIYMIWSVSLVVSLVNNQIVFAKKPVYVFFFFSLSVCGWEPLQRHSFSGRKGGEGLLFHIH